MSTTPKTPKKITVIPADPQMVNRDFRKQHLRVAPYCRVSTDKDEQLSSYEAQIDYRIAEIQKTIGGNRKVCMYGSVLGGLFLIILLI